MAQRVQMSSVETGERIKKGFFMLRAAIVFFVLGLVAYLFGAYGFAGVSIDVGKLLLVVFLVFSLISFIGSLTTGKPRDRIP
jgi:uncharacterized membrane protein YtjA (UPF0391 family)